jgi:hypothetical protein
MMQRSWIGVLALAASLSPLRAADELSVTLAMPQDQVSAPNLADQTADAPRPLRLVTTKDGVYTVILQNRSDRPFRLFASDLAFTPAPLSFRIDLDDGQSLFIRKKPSSFANSSSFHPVFHYWLLQPGEYLALKPRLYDGSWDWDEGKVAGHHGFLVPIYEVAPSDDASHLTLWTGHIEGKGVPIFVP